MKNALIIFVRNPVLGKVKTRLANTVGNAVALLVYKYLLQHTKNITTYLPVAKFVYYADEINNDDLWNGFEKRVQTGNDLGERMKNAFSELFDHGYTNICIIGSDCYELNAEIISGAFKNLQIADVVIGPVSDGGYYLLGSNSFVPDFFNQKKWSTNSVYKDTLEDIRKLQLTLYELPVLNDIDNESDLSKSSLAYLLNK